MDKITQLRTKIDELDQEIMSKLNERFDLALSIGEEKKLIKKRVLDESRESVILDKTSQFSHSPQLITIYKVIMEQSKSLQRK